VKREIEDVLGLDTEDAVVASAKANIGMEDILENIVKMIPPPPDTGDEPLRALIFDSYFDPYRGVVVIFRVVDGNLGVGDAVKFMNTGKSYTIDEIGIMRPQKVPVNRLSAGEVGYMIANIKSVADARVGDTITTTKDSSTEPLPGYSEATPMVYCGLFPTDSDQYEDLRVALGKLQINDAALRYEPEQSSAMGFGFRCGFLGLLHMEIVQERLEREYDLGLITTAPSVVYKVYTSDGACVDIANPADLPDASVRDRIEEPFVKLEMFAPSDYVGSLMELAQVRSPYTGPHTTPSAWRTPFLKDFSRRISPPTPRFQRPPATPFNSASDAFELHPDVASYDGTTRSNAAGSSST